MAKEIPAKRRAVSSFSREHMVEVAKDLGVTDVHHANYHSDQQSSPKTERINERELTSIYALLAYVAYNQNVRQETVQMIVEAQFGVDHVAKLYRHDYMRAIEFLVDMKLDEIIN